MKHNLKHLGLGLLLAALLIGLFTGAALAEGDGQQEDYELSAWLSTDALMKGENLRVDYNAREGYTYSLSIGLKDGDALTGLQGLTPETDEEGNSYFSVSWDALKEAGAEGQLCTVTVNETDGDAAPGSADFMVMVDSDYEVGLDVYGLDQEGYYDGYGVPVNGELDIQIDADDADHIWVKLGDEPEQDVTDWNWQEGFNWSRDYEGDFVFYVRAKFTDRYSGETETVISRPVFVHTYADPNYTLPAPTVSVDEDTSSTVTRGELITVNVSKLPELDRNREYNGMTLWVYVRENVENGDRVWDGRFDPNVGKIQIPTAVIPAGTYKVGAYWTAIGYTYDVSNEIEFTVTENTENPEALLGVGLDGNTALAHQEYQVYGYLPDAVGEKLSGYNTKEKGVCLFRDDEVIYEAWGEDSFATYDSYGVAADLTYTLGYWNAELKTWAKTSVTQKVSITAKGNLGEIGLAVTQDGETLDNGATIGAALEESLYVTLSEIKTLPEEFKNDPDAVWYDFVVRDTTEWNDLINEGLGYNDFTDGVKEIVLAGRDMYLQPGHEYAIVFYAHAVGYEEVVKEFRFMAVSKADADITLSLTRDDEAVDSVTVNENIHVTIDAPTKYKVAQLYVDNHWEDLWDWESYSAPIDPKDEDAGELRHWEGDWAFGGAGEQVLTVRATTQSEDEEINWEDEDRVAYGATVVLTVEGANGDAVLPGFALENLDENRGIVRGETLNVVLTPADEDQSNAILDSVNNYTVELERRFEEDDWQGIDWQDFEVDGENWTLPVSTMRLEGGVYRLVLHANGKAGYQNTETWREDPDVRFTVIQGEEDVYRIEVTGEHVEEVKDEEGNVTGYTALVNTGYRVSGFYAGAEAVGLYEGEEELGQWDGESFDWDGWDDYPAKHDYQIYKLDVEKDEFVKTGVGVRVVTVTSEDAPELSIDGLRVESRYGEGEDAKTIANALVQNGNLIIYFDADPNAESYYAEARPEGWDDRIVWWDDIRTNDGEYAKCYVKGTKEDDPGYFVLEKPIDWSDSDKFDRLNISVHAYSAGSAAAEANITVPVINAPDGKVTLTVFNPDGDEDFYVNQDFRARIVTGNIDDVTAVQLFIDGEWRAHGLEWDEDGKYWFITEGTGSVGAQTLYARVTTDDVDFDNGDFDWDNVTWSNVSNAEEVEFIAKGQGDTPKVSLVFDAENEERAVTVGAPLTIRFGALDGEKEANKKVYGYHVSILPADDPDNWDRQDEFDVDIAPLTGGDYSYVTGNLWPGHYCVYVELLMAPGYQSADTDRGDKGLYFTVNEAEDEEPSLTLYDSKGEVVESGALTVDTYQTFSISGAVPGHNNSVAIREKYDRREWDSDGRQTISATDAWENSGEYEYWLYYFDGVDEEWYPVMKGEGEDAVPYTVTVTVDASNGENGLAKPVIALEGPNDDNSYDFSVRFDENAQFRSVRVYRNDDWENEVFEENDPEVVDETLYTHTLTSDDLRVGERYTVFAWNGAPSYEASEHRVDFAAVAAQDENAEYAIALSLYDYDEEQKKDVELTPDQLLELISNRTYPVHIKMTYKGEDTPDNPDRLQLYWEGDWSDEGDFWPNDENDSYFSEDGHIFGYSCGVNYAFNAVVRAAWNVADGTPDEEVNWIYSNTLELKFTASGRVHLPESYAAVKSGDKVTVTVSGFESLINDGGDGIVLDILRRDIDDYYGGAWIGLDGQSVDPEGEAFTAEKAEDGALIVTIDLSKITREFEGEDGKTYTRKLSEMPGEYRVHLHIPAPEGMEANWIDDDNEKMSFDIPATLTAWKWDDEENDFVAADSSTITVKTGEEFRITGDVPSGVRYTLEGVEEWATDNGALDIVDCGNFAGKYTYHLYRFDEDEKDWIPLDGKNDPVITVTIEIDEDKGKLVDPVFVDVDETVSKGDTELSFSFTAPSAAKFIRAWIVGARPDAEDAVMIHADMEWDDEGNLKYDEDELPEGASITYKDGVYTVKAKTVGIVDGKEVGALVEGGKVFFGVRVAAPGYDATWVESTAAVVGETAEDTWLTINAQDETLEGIKSRQDLEYHLAIPARNVAGEDEEENLQFPVRAQIFLGDSWHDIGRGDVMDDMPAPEEFSNLTFNLDWLETGSHLVQVRATWNDSYDESEDSYDDSADSWTYSNTVRVIVTGETLEAPTVKMILPEGAPDGKIIRGKQLELHFAGESLEHIHEYHVRVYSDSELSNEVFFTAVDAAETVTLSTASLEEGNDYWIGVWFNTDVGYDSVDSGDNRDLRFRVVQGGDSFTLSKTPVLTKERFYVDAFIPGAEELRVIVDEGNGEYNEIYSDNDTLRAEYDFDHAGEYTFTLQRRVDEEWEDIGAYEGFNNPISVTVTAPNGTIGEAQVSLPPVVLRNEDGSYKSPEGGAYEIKVKLEGAEKELDGVNLNVEIFDEYDGESVWKVEETPAGAFTLPGLGTGRYRITVYAGQKGYEASYTEKWFEVMDAPAEDAPTVSLKVNGESESVTVSANEKYTISYDVQGLSDKYALNDLSIWWDEEWQSCLKDDSDYRFEDGVLTRTDDSGVRELVLMAEIEDKDGNKFTVTSNTVTLTVESEGTVPMPEVALSGLEKEEETGEWTIAQGKAFTVKVTIPQGEENADKVGFIDLNLKQPNEWGDYWDHVDGIRLITGNPTVTDETVEASVPTGGLTPGRYRVEIYMAGSEGYDGNSSDYDDQSLYFTVVERSEEEDVPTLTVPEKVTVGMDFMISGYLPGAEKISLFDGENIINDNGWEGSFQTSYKLDEAGEYTFTLARWFNGKWRKVAGASVTVTAEAKDFLDAPVVKASDAIVGEDYSFTVNAVENANRGYHVMVWRIGKDEEEDDDIWDKWYESDAFTDGVLTVTIPASLLGDEVGREFRIYADAQGEGYELNSTDAYFNLTERPVIEADKFEIGTEQHVGESFKVTAHVNGAAKLELVRNGKTYQSVNGDTAVINITESMPGVFGYALVATGEDGSAIEHGFEAVEVIVTQYGEVDPDSLSAFKLPSALTTIDEQAFSSIAAEKVIVPDNVGAIGSRAFENCVSLKVISIPKKATVAEDAFRGCKNLVVIERY